MTIEIQYFKAGILADWDSLAKMEERGLDPLRRGLELPATSMNWFNETG